MSASVAQLVERHPRKVEVLGSIPSRGFDTPFVSPHNIVWGERTGLLLSYKNPRELIKPKVHTMSALWLAISEGLKKHFMFGKETTFGASITLLRKSE